MQNVSLPSPCIWCPAGVVECWCMFAVSQMIVHNSPNRLNFMTHTRWHWAQPRPEFNKTRSAGCRSRTSAVSIKWILLVFSHLTFTSEWRLSLQHGAGKAAVIFIESDRLLQRPLDIKANSLLYFKTSGLC